jgi:hypothetical protein
VPLGGAHFRADEDGFTDYALLRDPFHSKGGCLYGGSPYKQPPNTPTLPPERLGQLMARCREHRLLEPGW